jgi:hypothetical protein
MGRSGLSREVVDQVKKRCGAAGEKTDVGITGKEGTKDEKRTEDEGGS